tara:strand:- start:82 stop:1086 length:1005 start_codon:yes stop_codon:yes gene_type:complete
MFVNFSSPCDVVDTDRYYKLVKNILPKYSSVRIIEIRNIRVDSIKFKNKKGQIINKARSLGTDKDNVRLLLDSLINQGWDMSKIPPIVELKDLSLYDGFSRHEALLNKNHEEAPYLVVEMLDGYTIDEVIDEIGLGANNHSQSRKATITDFKTRFTAFVSRQKALGNEVTTKDGLEWFAGIEHSFGDEQIEKAIEDVFNISKAKDTMEAFTKKEAAIKASEYLGVKKEKIFAYCKRKKSGESHYFKRMIGDVLDYYCDEDNTNFEGPTVVGFLARTPADEADAQRESIIKDCKKVNTMMRTIASKYAMDRDFEFINLKGFLPQILDEETDFIKY